MFAAAASTASFVFAAFFSAAGILRCLAKIGARGTALCVCDCCAATARFAAVLAGFSLSVGHLYMGR